MMHFRSPKKSQYSKFSYTFFTWGPRRRETKLGQKYGFTLIEVMLSMMIAALVLTPIFLIFTTVMQRVNKSSRRYDISLVCKNFLHEARQKQEPDVQDFSLEKKEIDFDATLAYSLDKGVPQTSVLKLLQGLHREIVKVSWQENGQKKQDQLVAFIYKKPEQKK